MGKSFLSAMEQTLLEDDNLSVTENGALGYRTTGKNLLDLNFAVASLRGKSGKEIAARFERAFYEDKLLAMKWLFFARDIRGGLGERTLFREALHSMAVSSPEYVRPVLTLVPEYGRWDDFWCLLDTPLRKDVAKIVEAQLRKDLLDSEDGNPISLLAKWMPRRKAHSAETRHRASVLMTYLGLTEREYQHMIADLTRYLKVVEQKMSAKQWDKIRYEAVPSRANLIYNAAFLRHDETRRREFLARVEKGAAKINAGTLFPHDIVNKYRGSGKVDATLEALWSALPDTVQGCGNTIVVQDDSGSMEWVALPGSSARPLDVAQALAIYFAERSGGEFRNRYITFSSRPKLIDLSGGKNLYERLRILRSHHGGYNTDVEAVFDLILNTAIQNRMEQSDLPANILIISDMEFDAANSGNSDVRLFTAIAKKYRNAGYKMPRLIFWNVASRTMTIPVRENESGVALVSGFSVNIAKMVMSGKLDPYECLLETLNTERYQPVEDALRPVLFN